MNKTASRKKFYFTLALTLLAIVLLDQLTKALVAQSIPYGTQVPLLPGIVHLTYVRNSGAAFSLLSGMQWLFLALLAVFLGTLALLIKKGIVSHPMELWCMTAIAGGAIGNAIDRAVTGSVVDMIEVEFIHFAVFNVADCFITCGAIAFAIYILFFSGKQKEKESDDAPNK